MFKKQIILFFVFTSLIYSQANISNSSSEQKTPHSNMLMDDLIPAGEYLNNLNKYLAKMEKLISERVAHLESLHSRISVIDKKLKDKLSIVEEVPNLTSEEGHAQIVSSREIEFTFQSDKTKQVKIVSRKMNMTNDLYSLVKTITFNPEKIDSLKIKVDQFNSKVESKTEVDEYNDLPLEVKIEALKAIDKILIHTINNFDAVIQKNRANKVTNGKHNFKDL